MEQQIIRLNLIPSGKMPVAYASQYDKSRKIRVLVFDGTKPYIFGDERVELDVRKPDTHIVTADLNVVSGTNSVDIETTEQMCAVAGNNECEIRIIKDDIDIGSLNFYMFVEGSPLANGLASDSEIANLRTQMQAIAEPMVEEIAPPIVEELVPQVIGDNYYTKTQTDNAIATAVEGKADKDNTYTKTQVDNALNNKMDKANPTGTGSFSLNRKANTVIGDYSHTEGYNNEASGSYSHAEGGATKASIAYAHAEGSATNASGIASHAEGGGTTSFGIYSHAEGVRTVANHKSQHVFGEWNKPDTNLQSETERGDYVEIVGNGTSGNQSNARTLDWQGNEMLAGDLTFNGNKSLTSEISRLDEKIDSKANASDVYTKSQTNNLLNDKADVSDLPDMSQYYDKSETDDLLDDKANSDDVYGKAYIDTALSGKANVGTSYTKSEEDALLANKADKSDTYTKEQVDDIVYNILPDDTASGSVANFTTSLELPIKSLEVDVNAVQESGTPTPATPLPISGWSEISLVNCGANLFDISTKTDGKALKWNDGDTFNDTMSIVSGFITVKEGYKLISNYIAQWCCYDKNKNYLGNILSNALIKTSGSDRADNTIPSGYGICYLRLGYRSALNNGDDMREKTDIMLNVGNSVLPYEPYNGNVELINLGGTYYGGHLTQDKEGHRQFVVTHKAKVKLRDVGYWNYSANGNRFYVNNVSDVLQKTDWNNHIGLCDCYVEGRVGNNQGDDLAYGFYNASLYLRDSNYSDVSTWLNVVGDYYITYQLATPIIIDLPDGQPIVTLNGTNNIYADSGDSAVVFKESVNEYVERKIASVQALALNT